MDFPEEVIAVTKKGAREVRSYLDHGQFLLYEYLDPETGRPTSNKKKLVLKGSKRQEFFMIPMKDGRILLVPAESKGSTRVWRNGEVMEF